MSRNAASPMGVVQGGQEVHGLRLLAKSKTRVDLIYIDPPYGTSKDFLIDEDRANSISASGELAYSDGVMGTEYLDTLAKRLEVICEIMAIDASICVHIDVKMEHRVRLVMDDVFGPRNFRNSITRIKCNPKNFNRNSFGNVKDTILFYSKSPDALEWNPQPERLSDEQVERLYPRVDADGRRFTTVPLHAPGATANGATGASMAWDSSSPWTTLALCARQAGRTRRGRPYSLEQQRQSPQDSICRGIRGGYYRKMCGSSKILNTPFTRLRRMQRCWSESSALRRIARMLSWIATRAAARR